MPLLAAVISTELPLSNVRLDTVADDQPDSNCPAACPEAASSTPLCFNEVRSPLVPLIVKTSPEPVSKVTFAAAEATWGAAPTNAIATATTTGPTHRRRPAPGSLVGLTERPVGRRPGSCACGCMGDPDLVRPSYRTPIHRRLSTVARLGRDRCGQLVIGAARGRVGHLERGHAATRWLSVPPGRPNRSSTVDCRVAVATLNAQMIMWADRCPVCDVPYHSTSRAPETAIMHGSSHVRAHGR